MFIFKLDLCNGEEVVIKNLSKEQALEMKKGMWTDGVLIKRNETTREIISPFIINKAFIIEQI